MATNFYDKNEKVVAEIDDGGVILSKGLQMSGILECAGGNIIFQDDGTNAYLQFKGSNAMGTGTLLFQALDPTGTITNNAGWLSANGFYANGSLSCGGAKPFIIPYPDGTPDKFLIHCCIESPENALMYRGTATTDETGSVTIELPDYYELINYPEGRTVQITQVDDAVDFCMFAAGAVVDGAFTVRSSVPGASFHWQVTSVRSDLAPLTPVVDAPDAPTAIGTLRESAEKEPAR
jgi:hypothetical protein